MLRVEVQLELGNGSLKTWAESSGRIGQDLALSGSFDCVSRGETLRETPLRMTNFFVG
jgi:hypothetical protein